eukprot:TRINITY_DN10424_c0_g1_i1.p1 TRINITY_DN10424_c0_g1~~TRINITY_DN10424_c0_g1_i1.p1  ORF type:complete len:407 (-),score=49.56 TRINITY_DN10424_c0_g1_i1:41-1261(-)
MRHLPTSHTLFANRAAAYIKVGKFQSACTDAVQCISLRPDWAKGYFRHAQALKGLSCAHTAYKYLLMSLTLSGSPTTNEGSDGRATYTPDETAVVVEIQDVLHMMNSQLFCTDSPLQLKFYDKCKGRGVVAKQNVSAGQVLFTEEPLAAALIRASDTGAQFCSACFLPISERIYTVCARCQTEQYCSQQCQERAWAAHHEKLCTWETGDMHILSQLRKRASMRIQSDGIRTEWQPERYVLEIVLRLIASQVQAVQKQATVEPQVLQDGRLLSIIDIYRSPSCPKTSSKFMDQSTMQHYVAGIKEALFYEPLAFLFTAQAFEQMMIQLEKNGTTVATGHVGGLYATHALVNHSDAPNAVVESVGSRIEAKALRNIEAGDEICFDYFASVATDNEKHRTELKLAYLIS